MEFSNKRNLIILNLLIDKKKFSHSFVIFTVNNLGFHVNKLIAVSQNDISCNIAVYFHDYLQSYSATI